MRHDNCKVINVAIDLGSFNGSHGWMNVSERCDLTGALRRARRPPPQNSAATRRCPSIRFVATDPVFKVPFGVFAIHIKRSRFFTAMRVISSGEASQAHGRAVAAATPQSPIGAREAERDWSWSFNNGDSREQYSRSFA